MERSQIERSHACLNFLTNGHKPAACNHTAMGQEPWHSWAGSLLRTHEAAVKAWSSWAPLPSSPGLWQNSFPCGCRTKATPVPSPRPRDSHRPSLNTSSKPVKLSLMWPWEVPHLCPSLSVRSKSHTYGEGCTKCDLLEGSLGGFHFYEVQEG